MNRFAIVALATLALAPRTALADEVAGTPPPSAVAAPSATGFVLGGGTIGSGKNAFVAEFGWPGLALTLLHGQSDHFDVGGSFAFVYGLEGIPAIAPGIRLNAVVRLNLLTDGKLSLGARVSPGFATYFPSRGLHNQYFYNCDYYYNDCTLGPAYHSSNVMFGLTIPVEIIASFLLTPMLNLNVGVAMPMTLFFTPEFSFVFPIEPGFGIEYKAANSLSLLVDMRAGPSVFMVPGGSAVQIAFRFQFGIAYRF